MLRGIFVGFDGWAGGARYATQSLKSFNPCSSFPSQLARDPVVTLCGHLYCWPCLFRWVLTFTVCVFSAEMSRAFCCARLYANLHGVLSLNLVISPNADGCNCRACADSARCVKRVWTRTRWSPSTGGQANR